MHLIGVAFGLLIFYGLLCSTEGRGFIGNLIGAAIIFGLLWFGFIWFFGSLGTDLKNAKKAALAPKRDEAQRISRELIKQHNSDLLSKRRRLVINKGYGLTDRSKWDAEKYFFISKVLRPALGSISTVIEDKEFSEFIDSCIDSLVAVRKSSTRSAPEVGKPIEYEDHCASLLEKAGWKVSTTKASGDQGADIIAMKNGLTVVLQCKQYSKPVGNAAVQEAFAAKAHYSADDAAVVTDSGYTKSANELAQSTGVLLLHPEELSELIFKL
ncbi:restriction endonuclease [Georgfuchsia toluolica]|uniref:restriction endonuclease n=1 Tax=Georgfuchsia toluolica TaxID=424218 RepID=UPI001C738637|nr:restriction endonuclease [Georgfuchsia toluolica]